MSAPSPGSTANNGCRTWYAESLADLQAMSTATRGPCNECLRINEDGLVFGSVAAGGTGVPGTPKLYISEAPGASSTVWNAA